MFLLKIIFLILPLSIVFAYPDYSTAVKEKKIYPMGKKIYKSRCDSFHHQHYNTYETLLETIEKDGVCGKLSHKHSEAVALYIWDLKREDSQTQHFEKLTVSKKEKCPVCGMYLYKYPTWLAKLEYEEKNYYFDGNKDLFKYYFSNTDGIKQVLVQDYYTQKTLDGKNSFFVIGSDVYGPMGHELIAFETLDAAKRFMVDHKGKKILKFQEIDEDLVYALDE